MTRYQNMFTNPRKTALISVVVGVIGLIAIWVAYFRGIPATYVYPPFTMVLMVLAGINYRDHLRNRRTERQ